MYAGARYIFALLIILRLSIKGLQTAYFFAFGRMMHTVPSKGLNNKLLHKIELLKCHKKKVLT